MNVVLRNRNGFPLPRSLCQAAFEHPFERLVQDFVGNSGTAQHTSTSAPRMDMVESALAFAIDVEIPGMKKEDAHIAVEGKRISFEAEVRRETDCKDGEALIHAERLVCKFTRTFTLPVDVDDDRAYARLENGVLHLVLPKKPAPQAKQIAVPSLGCLPKGARLHGSSRPVLWPRMQSIRAGSGSTTNASSWPGTLRLTNGCTSTTVRRPEKSSWWH